MSAPSGRAIAGRVLQRVDEDAAWAAPTLNAELARYPQLDERERAFATELTYGTLRSRAALVRALSAYVPRGLEKTDQRVRAHLLVAAYQLLVLDRVPAFAAVNAAVDLVRGERGPRPAGFANAVLRRLARSGLRLERSSAVWESVPSWLRERLERDVGLDEARALVGATDDEPAVCVRVREGHALPDFIATAERGRVSPLARLVRGAGDPRRRAGGSQSFVVQEEGAQVVALSLGARPGERVLDACAGRGQKTSLLTERVGDGGAVWASDLHPQKLAELGREHERLGLRSPRTSAVDLSLGPGELPGDFDRVLVDAPCSGSGTLRRRPEIALRLGPQDPARLAETATRILKNAATRARPGGRVVFAVCSVLREECEGVVERVGDLLLPAPFDASELGDVTGTEHCFRLLPREHGTDGYFVASFVRR
jgi:16S rRNA (cytosine967-C5)-methyltransferase